MLGLPSPPHFPPLLKSFSQSLSVSLSSSPFAISLFLYSQQMNDAKQALSVVKGMFFIQKIVWGLSMNSSNRKKVILVHPSRQANQQQKSKVKKHSAEILVLLQRLPSLESKLLKRMSTPMSSYAVSPWGSAAHIVSTGTPSSPFHGQLI